MAPLMDMKEGELKVPAWSDDVNALKHHTSWTTERNGKDSPSMPHWEDLAWQVQDDTERCCWPVPDCCAKRPAPRICALAGGVASTAWPMADRTRGRIRNV